MIRKNVKRRKIGRSAVRHQQKEIRYNAQNKPISAKNQKIVERIDFTKLFLAKKKRRLKLQKFKKQQLNFLNIKKFQKIRKKRFNFKIDNFFKRLKKLSILNKKIFYGFSKKKRKNLTFLNFEFETFYKVSYFNLNYFLPAKIFFAKKKELKQYFLNLKELAFFKSKIDFFDKQKDNLTEKEKRLSIKIKNENFLKKERLIEYLTKKKDVFFKYKKSALKFKYTLNFSKQKNNYFLAVNSRFNKLVYWSSAGQKIRVKAEKTTIHAIDALFRRVTRFLIQNRIFFVIILLKKIPLRFTKRILTGFKRLKTKVIKLLYAKKFLFSHSKGLRQKKKKRL